MSIQDTFKNYISAMPRINWLQKQVQAGNIAPHAAVSSVAELASASVDGESPNNNFLKTLDKNLEGINPSYQLNKEGSLIYTVGYTVGSMTKEVESVIKKAIAPFSYVKSKIDATKKSVLIFGQKAQVITARVKIEQSLKDLGVDFKQLIIDAPNKEIVSQELKQHLQDKIKKYSIEYIEAEQKVKIDYLDKNQASEEIKVDTIKNVLWPKLKTELQQSLSLIVVANSLQKNDVYIKKLTRLANKNHLELSSVCYLVKQEAAILSTLDGYEEIAKELPAVVDSINKYTNFTESATSITKFYLNIINSIIQEYVPHLGEEFRQERFVNLQDSNLNLLEIEQRIDKIKPMLERINLVPIVNKVKPGTPETMKL